MARSLKNKNVHACYRRGVPTLLRPMRGLSLREIMSIQSAFDQQANGRGYCQSRKVHGVRKMHRRLPKQNPPMHPRKRHILICDLCGGDPKCVKTCQEGGWNVLKKVRRGNRPYHLYARMPDEATRDLASRFYGEQAEEFV